MRSCCACVTAVLLFLYSAPSFAATRLPAIIGSNMVLQRDQPLPIWGWDEPGTEVTVTLEAAKAGETESLCETFE